MFSARGEFGGVLGPGPGPRSVACCAAVRAPRQPARTVPVCDRIAAGSAPVASAAWRVRADGLTGRARSGSCGPCAHAHAPCAHRPHRPPSASPLARQPSGASVSSQGSAAPGARPPVDSSAEVVGGLPRRARPGWRASSAAPPSPLAPAKRQPARLAAPAGFGIKRRSAALAAKQRRCSTPARLAARPAATAAAAPTPPTRPPPPPPRPPPLASHGARRRPR